MDLRHNAPLFIAGLVDRSRWEHGAWDNEPDFVYWVDRESGLRCLIVRHPTMGHLCGYVGVPKSHPAYHMHEALALENSLDVHGGITFNSDESIVEKLDIAAGQKYQILETIYPIGVEPTRWLGFDCAHHNDIVPLMFAEVSTVRGGLYKQLDYVRENCAHLANQLANMPGVVWGTPSVAVVSVGRRKIRVRRG